MLGAGTMGAQIAAHLANAGVPVVLLDVTPEGGPRRIEAGACAQARSVFHSRRSGAVTTGGFERDLERISGRDWIIEAVVEQLDIKQ